MKVSGNKAEMRVSHEYETGILWFIGSRVLVSATSHSQI